MSSSTNCAGKIGYHGQKNEIWKQIKNKKKTKIKKKKKKKTQNVLKN